MSQGPQVKDREVTEYEGMLLALILRQQPVTAYQIVRILEESPVISINTSRGGVYPAIARLKARRLVTGHTVEGDARNSEELHVTESGKETTRRWVRDINASHVILEDPLRIRLFSFDLLSREEQLEWIAQAKLIVKEREETIEEYDRSNVVPFQRFARSSVMDVLRVKMNWLDELLYAILKPR